MRKVLLALVMVTILYLLLASSGLQAYSGKKCEGSTHQMADAKLTPSNCSGFVAFVKELFENVRTLDENHCRYGATDNISCSLDTLKIMGVWEGYIGVYHSPGNNNTVRLAISTDKLQWIYNQTIEEDLPNYASHPTIAQAPNGAYIIAFEKEEEKSWSHLRFHYYSNLSALFSGHPDVVYDAQRSKFDGDINIHEGTPNIYNITLKGNMMLIRVGFHYDNGTVDNVAVGSLWIPLDDPSNIDQWVWNETDKLKKYNQKLRENYDVRGHIGDRDYGQIFGRNFTLQEAQYVKGNDSTWTIFLYDHLTNTFYKLNIKTHKGSTSFANPTFTVLNSPTGNLCIIVTYFLHTAGNAATPGEEGELIFFKEFPAGIMDEEYDLTIYSNSTIEHYYINITEKSINVVIGGEDGTRGYCIIKLPNWLTQDLWHGNFTVLLDGESYPFENWTDNRYTYIYLDYRHSEHEIKIVPEFSHIIILTVLVGLSIFVLYNKGNRWKTIEAEEGSFSVEAWGTRTP